jgi:hypothetical protein
VFFLLLVDDHNWYMWLSLMANKSEALAAVQQFQARVEVELGRRLWVLHTDNGVSSPLFPSSSTAPRAASSANTLPPTHCSRTASSSGEISPSSPWRGVS